MRKALPANYLLLFFPVSFALPAAVIIVMDRGFASIPHCLSSSVGSALPVLKDKSAEKLRGLLMDKNLYSAFLHSYDQVRHLDMLRNDLRKRNTDIARHNMGMEAEIAELKNQCIIIRKTPLAVSREKFEEVEEREKVVNARCSPASLLNKISSNFVRRFPVESFKGALQFPSLLERSGIDAFQRTLLNSREDETSTWNRRELRKDASTTADTLERPRAVDEVHLRRYDDLLENGGVHRRVVAAITVQSPTKDVWNVLTDYECLSEFIPNLASSKIISRENNRVRLVQEGCKYILYMALHARVVLELWEKPEHEILFQQVEGDFDSFQGKWTLEALGTQHTLLKYVVDTKMHKQCHLAEGIVEKVVYEDLPANLCAIRDRVESLKLETTGADATPTSQAPSELKDDREIENSFKQYSKLVVKSGNKRFRVAGLHTDFKVLERELSAFIEDYGKAGVMPMRSELRQHKRFDLEKAISRMGGFSTVASKLNLCQQRRPRGYWDNFQNVHKEIMQIQKEYGMDTNYLPTRKALNNVGRPDVARALEKWGGANEVARLLGLKVRRVKHLSPRETKHSEASDLENDEFTCPKPFKISLPEKARKWVDMKQKM